MKKILAVAKAIKEYLWRVCKVRAKVEVDDYVAVSLCLRRVRRSRWTTAWRSPSP